MAEALMILGMFVVTFGIRYLLWASAGRLSFPKALSEALTFVPVAVLTAIIVPAVLISDGSLNLSWHNPYLLAAVAAFALALWKNNLLLTISLGMLIFMLLKWGLGL